MSSYELAGHASFALIALSFLVKDILWLRVLSVVASVAGIGYNYFGPATPLWLVIYWNIFFLAINLGQIFLILRERHGVEFSEAEKEIYETIFYGFAPFEFMKLLRIGEWKNAEPGEILAVQDKEVDSVMLIYNGLAEVEINGEKVAELKDGNLVGEMSYFTGGLATATVRVLQPTRYLFWKKAAMDALSQRNPSMQATLRAVLSIDLAKKLLKKTK
jgi:hypothetical protein